MNRAALAGMFNGQTTACEPAKAALLGGGDFVIWDGTVPGQQLARIYGARHRRARRRGAETLALSTAPHGHLARLTLPAPGGRPGYSPDRMGRPVPSPAANVYGRQIGGCLPAAQEPRRDGERPAVRPGRGIVVELDL
jgi:hypothetical protein